MKPGLWILCVAISVSMTMELRAQDDGEEEPGTESASVAAQYILRLEATIADQEKTLAKLKKELASRDREYEKVATRAKALQERLEEDEAQLRDLEFEQEPEQVQALERQVTRLNKEVELVNKQLAYAFNLKKNVVEHIRTLQNKLKQDRTALVTVKNGATAPPVVKQAGQDPIETRAPTPRSSTAAPIPGMVSPTIPPTTPGAQPPAKDEQKPETAEQIAARIDVARQEAKAERIAAFEVDFARRKELLVHQIKLVRNELTDGKEAVANLEELLQLHRHNLAQQTDAGAKPANLEQLQKEIRQTEASIKRKQRRIAQRASHLDELNEELNDIRHEEQLLKSIAEKAREEAAAARARSLWLRSPVHPQNIQLWAEERGPSILMALAAIVVLLLLLRLTVRGVTRMIVGRVRGIDAATRKNRADTMALSFRSAGSGLILLVGILMVFEAAGVNVATLLGGAAIFGVALAFGAQYVMRDYLNGFLILLENQYKMNDIITIDTVTGVVEKVNMRATVLRDLEGRAHFIPNGQIKAITNHTYLWARAVFDIPVAYKEDVDKVMGVLVNVGNELRADPLWKNRVTDEPVMLGVDKFQDSAVIIKFMIKTKDDQKWAVKRETLRRIKKRFHELGIEIPMPHRIVFERKDDPMFPPPTAE